MDLKELREYTAYAVPMKLIWVDPDFNCRGRFTPESVSALAKDIDENGLKYPLIVQPWEKSPEHDYRLIAGFRRFAACALLHLNDVPAMVTEKDISEYEAHRLNLVENLERQDLNILEEARGIAKLYPHSETPGTIAKELNRPRQWVYRRLGLLDLPHEVQLMFASGRLAQRDLDVVLAYRNDSNASLEAAQKLLRARQSGPETSRSVQHQLQRGKRVNDRRRTKAQIAAMIDVMFRRGIDDLPTRVAAWCAGTITTDALMKDIKAYRPRKQRKPKKRKRKTE